MSVQRNVIVNYLGSGLAAVVGMAVLPLYIRYLGIESYGLIGFFATLQAWLFLLDMGLSPTLNREMARFSTGQHTSQSIHDLLKSMEVVYAGVALFLFALIAGLSSWIASDWLKLQRLSTETVAQMLAIMGVSIALQWMGTLYRSALFGLQHHVWLSLVTAGLATLRAAGTALVLAFVSPTFGAFVAFQCGVSLLEVTVLSKRVHSQLPRAPQPSKFSWNELRNVWRFAAGLGASTFFATLLMQIDKLLLAKLLPLDQYGYFSLAVTVAGALSLLISPIYNVAYPRLTALASAGSEEEFCKDYHRFAQFLSITLLPAMLILCFFSKQIIFLWTGDLIMSESVAPIISIWVVGNALNGLMHIPYVAQLAYGWVRLSIFVNAVAVIIMIPAILFLVPRYGVLAAAWIWISINLGYIIFGIAIMHKRLLKLEKWKWYMQDVLLPLVFGTLVALVLYFINKRLKRMETPLEIAFFLGVAFIILIAVALSTPIGRQAVIKAISFRKKIINE